MARKGTIVWELESPATRIDPRPEDEDPFQPYMRITRYALRTDGVLVQKVTTKDLYGRARHDWGWKVVNRRPPADAKKILMDRGYF